MPVTPDLWTSATASLLVSPYDPQVIQLTNGNILVTYSTPGFDGGTEWEGLDIVGRIFSPLGVPVGGEFVVNQEWGRDDETDMSLAALPSGGFLGVYIDTVSVVINDLRLEQYDAAGNQTRYRALLSNSSADPSAIISPVVAVSSATSALVAYVRDGATDRVNFRLYDPTTNAVLPQLLLLEGASTSETIAAIDATVLQNGNYLVLASIIDGTNRYLAGRMVSPTGTILDLPPLAETIDDATQDSDPSVAALTGGGFVVSWTSVGSDTDIHAQVFDAAGNPVGARLAPGDSGASDNDNESSVVALADGGFIVFWDDYTAGGGLRGQRYDAAGSAIGGGIFVPAVSGTQIDATLLADGRVAVTWVDYSGGTGEVRLDIFDPRTAPNAPVYPVPTIIGTAGNDVIAALAEATRIYGWRGADRVFGGGGDDTIDGGIGNDRIDGGADADSLIGGGGNDTLIGGAGDDRLFGGSGTDLLNGGAGRDRLSGGGQADILVGGAMADTLSGGGGADIFDFNLRSDSNRTAFDTITDFARGQDRIDLSTIDANAGLAGNQAFRFVAGSGGIAGPGQARFAVDATGVTLNLYIDGDALADMVIRLDGLTGLAARDLIL